MLNKTLLSFYFDVGTDTEDRTHFELLAMTDEQMHSTHDFIQWLFPTFTPSAYNRNYPVLNQETIDYMKDDAVFQTRFGLGIKRMFDYFQLKYYKQGKNFVVHPITEKLFWMEYDNHNLLRLTRIMESCRLFGYEETAMSLLNALVQTIKTHPEFYFVQIENLYWWYKATTGANI